jgi:hypothetical protein
VLTRSDLGKPPREPFVIQLREARAEWKRRTKRRSRKLAEVRNNEMRKYFLVQLTIPLMFACGSIFLGLRPSPGSVPIRRPTLAICTAFWRDYTRQPLIAAMRALCLVDDHMNVCEHVSASFSVTIQ